MTHLRACEGVSPRPARNRRQTATALSLSVLAAVSLSVTALSARPALSAGPKKRSKAALIKANTAILRTGPGKSHKAKALLDEGRAARVVGHKDGWVKLRLRSGTEGWVRRDLVNVAKKATRDSNAAAAESRPSRKRRVADDDTPRRVASRKSKAKAKVYASKPVRKTRTVAAAKSRPVYRPAARPATRVVASRPAFRPAPAFRPVSFSKPTQAVLPAPVTFTAARTVAAPGPDESGPLLRPINLRPAAAAITQASREAQAASLAAQKEATSAPAPSPAPQPTPAPESPATQPAEAPKPAPKPATAPQAKIDRSSTRGERIAKSALAYRGTPYRRGASGRGAFDCSGFTMYLFGKEGEHLPRTAADQFSKGQRVDRSDLQAGDLVFFKNTYKRGISHVGVYLGDGQFVHAAGSGRGVRVDNLSRAYYVNHWAGARRPK